MMPGMTLTLTPSATGKLISHHGHAGLCDELLFDVSALDDEKLLQHLFLNRENRKYIGSPVVTSHC